MYTYPISLVPGPVSVPQSVREAYLSNYGSADIEREYLDLYQATARNLKQILQTQSDITIMTGEGMLALWSALKSCLSPNDRVLAISTGIFGQGIGEIARHIGANVKFLNFNFDQAANQFEYIADAIESFQPKMITVVHCETPSGILNPIAEIGQLKKNYQVPLLYVDAVASIAGAPVNVDDWHIDLCLGSGQKALSALPDLCFLSVSPAAWEIINNINYKGYDALQPFQNALQTGYFPYTPHWHGLAGLQQALKLLLSEGLEQVYLRHHLVAAKWRKGLKELGLQLYPQQEQYSASTVTAVRVPATLSWPDLNRRLRERGMVVGGNYGPLANQVFRIGHMGSQATFDLLERGLAVLTETLK